MAVHEELRRLTRDDDDEAESAQETTASLREDLNSMLAQMQDVVRLRWLLAAGPLDHELNSPPPLEQNNSEEPLVPDVAMDAVDEKARMARNGTSCTPLRRRHFAYRSCTRRLCGEDEIPCPPPVLFLLSSLSFHRARV